MTPREGTDEWLMSRVASGREQALEKLMKKYHLPLLSFITRQTDLEAEDIYQETWMRVVRNAGRFDTRKRFSTWLFQIALNLCRDAHRRRSVRGTTLGLDHADRVIEPEEDRERRELLQSGLSALPESDRELLNLRYYEGFKEKEVADILGIPVGTVKGRTHRAVERLRRIIHSEN